MAEGARGRDWWRQPLIPAKMGRVAIEKQITSEHPVGL
jgi:hypothetical protein